MNPSLILEEIFDSILKEVTEEVNIPIQNLSSPVLLGVSYNPLTMRTPSLEFYLKCDLSTREIKELYTKRIEGDIEESTELIIIPVEEVLDNDVEELKYYDQLTFGAKAVITFFKVFSSK
ncbi:hypothetical protein AVEN_78882-1 [Araneus ventricosus]|uniref:Nudix hydrolase domain-containing protein n=1 Tax=Araneus ventricosus TaxID=182803 RepID=A0A4Y2G1G4_ARAVE|nr:hypothetical protein AVEN_78882-1 [Araneus ventricosus]